MDEKPLIHDIDVNFEEFAELYRRNITRVYRYHMVHVGNANAAEDLTSQTFMAALKEFASFRKEDSFVLRIFEIAVAKCLKDPRWSRREFPNDAVLYYQVSSLSTNRSDLQRMELESVSGALKQISWDRAEAISLYFFGDLTNSEISIVLNKSIDTIEALISRGLEDETLINKLSNIAAQIRPDPLFEAELEQTLAAHYRPKTKWTLPLQPFFTIIGWAALIGLTFFLLSWRVTPNTSTTPQATARPSTQDVKKAPVVTITSTPHRPTASPTATDIPVQEYTVQAGDTCTYIANKFGLTIELLITLNRLNNTCDIWADQKLKVPVTPIFTPSS